MAKRVALAARALDVVDALAAINFAERAPSDTSYAHASCGANHVTGND